MVLPPVFLQRGVDAQHQAQRTGDEDGIEVYQNGIGQLADQHVPYGKAFIHLLAHAPVPRGDDALPEQEILHHDGLVVAHLLTLGHDEVDVAAHLAHGWQGQQLDQHKAHGHDDEQRQEHEQNTFDYIFGHPISPRQFIFSRYRLP